LASKVSRYLSILCLWLYLYNVSISPHQLVLNNNSDRKTVVNIRLLPQSSAAALGSL